jgi:hypothetical protein
MENRHNENQLRDKQSRQGTRGEQNLQTFATLPSLQQALPLLPIVTLLGSGQKLAFFRHSTFDYDGPFNSLVGGTRRRFAMRKTGSFSGVLIGGLVMLSLAWTSPVQAEDVLNATAALEQGSPGDRKLSLDHLLVYCLQNWRSLPAQAVEIGQDIVAENGMAILVMIGGHGLPKTQTLPAVASGDIPPPPKDVLPGTDPPGKSGVPPVKENDPGKGKGPPPDTPPSQQTPEPSTLVLGLVGAGWTTITVFRRRRRHNVAAV